MIRKFITLFTDVTKTGTKIPKEEYLTTGKNIIIDQGKDSIAGYTDRQKGIFKEVPVIVFGDHTRIVKYVDKPFFLGADGVKVLKSKEKESNYKYLYYALKAAHIPNTGYNRHFKWLKQININYPGFNEQKNIVDILDSLTRIIKVRQKELALFDKLIKARFVEMFGDPISNNFNWNTTKLKNITSKITNGSTPKGGSKNYVNSGVMFLRSQNIWRNHIDSSDVVFISEKTNLKLQKSVLKNNDILITKTGRINTQNSSLGRAALYSGKDNSANINGHVYLIRLKNHNLVLPRFLVTVLTGEAYRKYIRKVCVGGIDKRQINLNQVENFPIILPPVKKQQEFISLIQQVDKSKFENIVYLDKTLSSKILSQIGDVIRD